MSKNPALVARVWFALALSAAGLWKKRPARKSLNEEAKTDEKHWSGLKLAGSTAVSAMKRQNIHRTSEWFKVLQTTKRSQTAVMKLGPGQATGEEPEAHEKSDQVLLLVAGDLSTEIGGKRSR